MKLWWSMEEEMGMEILREEILDWEEKTTKQWGCGTHEFKRDMGKQQTLVH